MIFDDYGDRSPSARRRVGGQTDQWAGLSLLYPDCAFKQLGFSKSINKTRLKQQFLEHFMEAKEETDGKKVLLVFREGMKEILKDAVKERDFSEDALILAKPAKILRNDIFNHQPFKFDNEFPPHCQENSAHYS